MILTALYVVSEKVTDISTFDFTAFVQKFTISDSLANRIGEVLAEFGIDWDGPYFPVVITLMSNSFLIYTCYLFTEVLVFIPKFAISIMNIPNRKGDI